MTFSKALSFEASSISSFVPPNSYLKRVTNFEVREKNPSVAWEVSDALFSSLFFSSKNSSSNSKKFSKVFIFLTRSFQRQSLMKIVKPFILSDTASELSYCTNWSISFGGRGGMIAPGSFEINIWWRNSKSEYHLMYSNVYAFDPFDFNTHVNLNCLYPVSIEPTHSGFVTSTLLTALSFFLTESLCI